MVAGGAGGFVDYYDCIQGMGYDPTLVYERKQVELDREDRENLHVPSSITWRGIASDVTSYLVVFCGKPYPLLHLEFRNKYTEPKYKREPVVEYWCYSQEAAEAAVAKHYSESEMKAVRYAGRDEWKTSRHLPAVPFNRYKLAQFFGYREPESVWSRNQPQLEASWYEAYAEKAKSPAIVVRATDGNQSDVTTLDACLKEVHFQSVFDPYLAYQEITMFMGRIGWPGNRIPEVSDKDMIQAKGFDLKASFRKDAGKVKPRKAKKRKRGSQA